MSHSEEQGEYKVMNALLLEFSISHFQTTAGYQPLKLGRWCGKAVISTLKKTPISNKKKRQYALYLIGLNIMC